MMFCGTQTRLDGRMSIASVSCFGRSGDSDLHRFEPWSGQTDHFKIDTCHFLASRSALLGWVKDWLAQCQDSVAEWNIIIRSWCRWPGLPVEQHDKVALSVR